MEHQRHFSTQTVVIKGGPRWVQEKERVLILYTAASKQTVVPYGRRMVTYFGAVVL